VPNSLNSYRNLIFCWTQAARKKNYNFTQFRFVYMAYGSPVLNLFLCFKFCHHTRSTRTKVKDKNAVCLCPQPDEPNPHNHTTLPTHHNFITSPIIVFRNWSHRVYIFISPTRSIKPANNIFLKVFIFLSSRIQTTNKETKLRLMSNGCKD